MSTTTEREIEELKRDCAYHERPDEADYEVDDSVDTLITYKDALESRAYAEGAVLDRVSAIVRGPERNPYLDDVLDEIAREMRKVRS